MHKHTRTTPSNTDQDRGRVCIGANEEINKPDIAGIKHVKVGPDEERGGGRERGERWRGGGGGKSDRGPRIS